MFLFRSLSLKCRGFKFISADQCCFLEAFHILPFLVNYISFFHVLSSASWKISQSKGPEFIHCLILNKFLTALRNHP